MCTVDLAGDAGEPLSLVSAMQSACHTLTRAQSTKDKPRPVAILIHHCLAHASEDRREGRLADADLFETFAKWFGVYE